MRRWLLALSLFAVLPFLSAGLVLAEPPAKTDAPKADALPAEYKTVETASAAKVGRAAAVTVTQPAYLGINLDADGKGGLVVADVSPDSPAAKAGVQRGDRLLSFDGKDVKDDGTLHELVKAHAPGDAVKVGLTRQGKRNPFFRIDQRRDSRGNPYFWIGFERAAMMDTPAEGTDLAALAARYVSVTPLRLDRTDEAFSEALTETLK